MAVFVTESGSFLLLSRNFEKITLNLIWGEWNLLSPEAAFRPDVNVCNLI
jgi:hypothetical protein